jgi:small-conductance mechanosensitive channel
MDALEELWAQIGTVFQDSAAQAVPPVLAALLLLLLGWILAVISQALVTRVLRRLGLDRMAERAGASQTLTDLGVKRTVSGLLGRFVYWLVLLIFVLAAVRRLGLTGVDQALTALTGYLPSILAASLILFLGVVIAHFVGDAVGAFALRAGIRGGLGLGAVTRYTILVLAVILALEQLNLQTGLLVMITLIVVGAVALALGLAFGLGSRSLAHSIMAGLHARESFAPGEELVVRKHRGRLVRIDAVTTVLETDEGLVSIPNVVLVEEDVLVLARAEGSSGAREASADKESPAAEAASARESASSSEDTTASEEGA